MAGGAVCLLAEIPRRWLVGWFDLVWTVSQYFDAHGNGVPYLAVNSSNVSSACSLRREMVVLKLRPEPAIMPGTMAALAREGATGRYARKKVWVGPRTATRRREVEDMASPSAAEGSGRVESWWAGWRSTSVGDIGIRIESCNKFFHRMIRLTVAGEKKGQKSEVAHEIAIADWC
jgi:hypothetical protein